MRLTLVLAAVIATLVGCESQLARTNAACPATAELARGQIITLRGDLYVDQHGDFVRPSDCSTRSLRLYGIRTANGAAAAALRKEIDDTLTLFEVHWAVDITVRAEWDSEGQIFRVLSVHSAKRIGARPNNSFKPTPLRGAA